MKTTSGLIRKFVNEINSLDEEIIKQVIKESRSTLPNDKLKLIDRLKSWVGKDVKLSEFRCVWKISELSTLFSNWVSMYKLENEVPKILKKQFIGGLGNEYTNSLHFTYLELLKSPKIIALIHYNRAQRKITDRVSSNEYFVDRMYLFPGHQFILSESNDDDELSKMISFLEPLLGTLTLSKFRTYNLSKIYSDELMINHLAVKAIHEITGFSGLEQIVFEGEHVKEGLYGLHKRQDIRVNMDQIGPRVAISTSDLELRVGTKIRLRNPEGLKRISKYLI